MDRRIAAAWDSPDDLGLLIVEALDQGRAGDVVQAAYRLREIDPDLDRGVSMLAVVLRGCGDHEVAEEVLLAHLRDHPGSADVWFNLAPLAAWRGNQADVETALTTALERDRNHAPALEWGFRHLYRAGGAEAAIGWLWGHAAGSWRAHLMLGCEALRWNGPARALEYFDAALDIAPDERELLTEAAQALLVERRYPELVDLVGRRWRDLHGPLPVMCGIEACLELGRPVEAARQADRLRAMPVPAYLRDAATELDRRVRVACERADRR